MNCEHGYMNGACRLCSMRRISNLKHVPIRVSDSTASDKDAEISRLKGELKRESDEHIEARNLAVKYELERNSLRSQLEQAQAENERLNKLIEIADVLITNENAMEDWKNAKSIRVM